MQRWIGGKFGCLFLCSVSVDNRESSRGPALKYPQRRSGIASSHLMSSHCRPVDSCARVRDNQQDDHGPVWLGLQFRKQCAKLIRREYVWICLPRRCRVRLTGLFLEQLPSDRTLQQHPLGHPEGGRLDYSDKQEIRGSACRSALLSRGLGAPKRLAGGI